MSTVRELLAAARARLDGRVEAPDLDAQVLLAHALGRDRSWLFAWPEHTPGEAVRAAFERLLEARIAGEPVAYLTGEREFWSLNLKVNRHTLIPRPETELLVEIALDLALPPDAQVLDLGTGSGAIALAIAHERPAWQITALDRSTDALAVARENAAALGIDHIVWRQSDWFSALAADAHFDLILGNPPYIAIEDPHLTQGDVRFEPHSALVAGGQGLSDIRRIVNESPAHLRRGGWLCLEHGFEQAPAVRGLLRDRGFDDIATHADHAGHSRHSGGRLRAED